MSGRLVDRLRALHRERTMSWWTVALFAVVMAYGDGFWLTSAQGAIGAIERTQSPFDRWLRDSSLMVPVFAVAVIAALSFAQRRSHRVRSGAGRLTIAILAVVAAGSVVGIAEATASSVYDYSIQSSHIDAMNSMNSMNSMSAGEGVGHAGHEGSCVGCAARSATISAHKRALLYVSGLVLVTNAVLVLWTLALRGGRVWAGARAGAPATVTGPVGGPGWLDVGEELEAAATL